MTVEVKCSTVAYKLCCGLD